MIKAVVFDFNGLFVEAIEKKIISNVCFTKGVDKWIAYSNYYLNLWKFEKGYISPLDFWKKIFVHLTDSEYKTLVEDEYDKRQPRNEAVFALAHDLSKKFDLYVLSNSNFLQGKSYRKQKLYSSFKDIFLSHEMHQMKPFPSIYNHFLHETKLKAKDCLFIDDSTANVVAAMSLGFKGVIFQNSEGLEEKLKEMNLL